MGALPEARWRSRKKGSEGKRAHRRSRPLDAVPGDPALWPCRDAVRCAAPHKQPLLHNGSDCSREKRCNIFRELANWTFCIAASSRRVERTISRQARAHWHLQGEQRR